jgi:flagellar hook-associated protein 3 FlgL
MRITDVTFRMRLMSALRANVASLQRAQQRAATGRRIERASDDPVGATQVMRLQGSLREIEQFKSNTNYADTRLSAEDVTITAARDLMDQAKKLAYGAANSPPGDPIRDQAIAQIGVIREQLISLANTRVGSEYIFGGAQTGAPPFLANGTYAGDTTLRRVQVGEGDQVAVNHTGDQLFSNSIAGLDNLDLALQSGTTFDVNLAGTQIEGQRVGLLTLQAEVGGRLRGLRDNTTRLAQIASDVVGWRDATQNVPQDQAVVEAIAAQTALEQTYAVVGRVAKLSLTDYLT